MGACEHSLVSFVLLRSLCSRFARPTLTGRRREPMSVRSAPDLEVGPRLGRRPQLDHAHWAHPKARRERERAVERQALNTAPEKVPAGRGAGRGGGVGEGGRRVVSCLGA